MANLTEDAILDTIGAAGPWQFDLPVDGGSEVFTGSLCTQLTATGCVVPYSTASAGKVVGVAQHAADNTAGADGAKRVRIETGRVYVFDNGAGGDAFSEASLIGAIVYGTDDHTVADNSDTQARKAVGFFMGMESDGKVRVLVVPWLNAFADATLLPA
jgi:hypothetical protein